MTYSSQDMLVSSAAFFGRVRACCVEQAGVFTNDTRPSYVSLAESILMGDDDRVATFLRLVAGSSGLGDKAISGGVFDQSLVLDADILGVVQGNWGEVAGLYTS
jgi:hypothetical protein